MAQRRYGVAAEDAERELREAKVRLRRARMLAKARRLIGPRVYGHILLIRLRERRVMGDLTQRQCAARLGISRDRWANWEAGIAYPPLVMALQVARMFGCSVEDIWETEEGSE